MKKKDTKLHRCYSACFLYSDPNNGLGLLTLLASGGQVGPGTHTKVPKQDLTHRKLEEKLRERIKMFGPCSRFQDGLFVFPTRGGNRRSVYQDRALRPDSLQVLLIFPPAGKYERDILLTGMLARLQRRLQIVYDQEKYFLVISV